MNIIKKIINKICSMNNKDSLKLSVNKKSYTEWLNEQPNYGMCCPPMDAQTALNYLFDYLDIAPINMSQSEEQCNTIVVYEILYKFSPKFRKEIKNGKIKNSIV